MTCAKCKTEFEPSAESFRKIKKGHVPLCVDCWHAVYRGLPPPASGKVGYVEAKMVGEGVPTRGTKKYLCRECKHERMEPWVIQDRAARIRCPGCGSLDYRPKTGKALADIIDKQDVAKSFGDVKGSDGGGSFVRG